MAGTTTWSTPARSRTSRCWRRRLLRPLCGYRAGGRLVRGLEPALLARLPRGPIGGRVGGLRAAHVRTRAAACLLLLRAARRASARGGRARPGDGPARPLRRPERPPATAESRDESVVLFVGRLIAEKQATSRRWPPSRRREADRGAARRVPRRRTRARGARAGDRRARAAGDRLRAPGLPRREARTPRCDGRCACCSLPPRGLRDGRRRGCRARNAERRGRGRGQRGDRADRGGRQRHDRRERRPGRDRRGDRARARRRRAAAREHGEWYAANAELALARALTAQTVLAGYASSGADGTASHGRARRRRKLVAGRCASGEPSACA